MCDIALRTLAQEAAWWSCLVTPPGRIGYGYAAFIFYSVLAFAVQTTGPYVPHVVKTNR